MRKLIFFVILAVGSHVAYAEGNRPTSADDLKQIEQLQRQVDRLSIGPLGTNNYSLCKARAWLDMATVEYHGEDHTGIVQDATQQAVLLLQELDKNPGYISLDTPHPYASEKVRDDLWQASDKMKRDNLVACVACDIAKLEVQLVWVGHEKWESGWSHAEPYVRIAENLAHQAQASLTQCAPAPVVAASPVPEQASVPPVIIEKFTLAAETLFTFDNDMLASDGLSRLNKIVADIRSWNTVQRIQINGHTDRLNRAGGPGYNMRLSQRRADHVKAYLVSQGIAADLIEAAGLGDGQPLVQCREIPVQKDRRDLISCLKPNRRVDLIIEGVR